MMSYLPYGGCNIFEDPFEKEVWNGFMMVPRYKYSGAWTLPPQLASIGTAPKAYHFDKNGFTAFIDVHLFEADEICVKTVYHTIIVECHHEQRDDHHGPVERHFVRKFNLPAEYDMMLAQSTLLKDGVLLLDVPLPKTKTQGEVEERVVEVHESEKPSLIMSLLSNRAHSMMKHSHSVSDEEEDCDDA